MRTENNTASAANHAAIDYLDGFIDEAMAADFLYQSVRTLQKWRVTGFGPKFYKTGRSVRYRCRALNERPTPASALRSKVSVRLLQLFVQAAQPLLRPEFP